MINTANIFKSWLVKLGLGGMLSFIFLLFVFIPVSFSQNTQDDKDNFSILETITVGQEVGREVLSLGTKVADPQNLIDIYTFDSNEYAHPHILYITDGQVSFIQLTIPFSLEQKYQDMLSAYGKNQGQTQDAMELTKTEIETMVAFPRSGIAFVLNGRNGKVLRVKKYPSKSKEEFINNEGKGFTPDAVSTPSFIPKDPSFDIIAILKYGLITFSGLVLVIFVLIFLKKRKTNKPPENTPMI